MVRFQVCRLRVSDGSEKKDISIVGLRTVYKNNIVYNIKV